MYIFHLAGALRGDFNPLCVNITPGNLHSGLLQAPAQRPIATTKIQRFMDPEFLTNV
jgi:hypothetical protein